MNNNTLAAPDSRRWWALAVVSLGVALIIVDATIVNVAVPSIIRDLRITLNGAEWINSIYSLVFAALLITLGRIGDLAGRKRLYIIGLLVFLGASMLAGLAPNGTLLIAARVIQGIGGAIIFPATLSIVNTTFQGRERGIAFGIWGSIIGGTVALGPLLGGLLTTTLSWRWAFYINLPIGLLALLGTLVWVRESRDEHARRGFDLAGFLTSTIGLASLIFALIEGQSYGWWRPALPFTLGGWTWPGALSIVPSAFALATVCLASFVVIEGRRTRADKPVLIDVQLFRLRSFAYGNLTVTIVSLGEFGMIFVLPLFLQSVREYSAFQTGLVLLPLAAGSFLSGGLAAFLSERVGPRRVVTAGMALEAIGIGSLSVILSPTITGWTLVPSLLVYGLGVGLATAQLTGLILADVPPARSGQASGMQSTFRQVGSALGIAVLGTVLAVTLGNETQSRLAHLPHLPPGVRAGITASVKATAGQALTQLRRQPGNEAVVKAVDDALTQATHWAALAAALFVLCGFVMSWLLPNPQATPRDPAEERGEQPARSGVV